MLIVNLFIWFVIYSLVGWVWESLLFTVQEKRFVNRGFLNGPICPIYGVGALLLIWALSSRTDNIIILFLASLILTTSLEYLTAVLMEKLFKAKWWDYSMFPLNFQGRISLISSLFFAIGSVLLIRYIHPFIMDFTGRIPVAAKQVFVLIFILYLVVDLSVTVRHVFILNGRLNEIQCAINNFFGKYAKRAGELRNAILVNFEESEFYSERIKTLFSLDRFQNRRIFRAFPKLRSLSYDDAMRKLKERLLGVKDKSDGEEE